MNIEAIRARLLYDVSPEALERARKTAAHIAAWGTPARCQTGSTGMMGECLNCGAIQGECCIPTDRLARAVTRG